MIQEIVDLLEDRGVVLELQLNIVSDADISPEDAALIKNRKQELINHLAASINCVPELPWQLKNLLRANSSNTLSVSIEGITNIKNYIYAYVCGYLLGDRERALEVLFKVYDVWQKQAQLKQGKK